jgi:hypothetical protein
MHTYGGLDRRRLANGDNNDDSLPLPDSRQSLAHAAYSYGDGRDALVVQRFFKLATLGVLQSSFISTHKAILTGMQVPTACILLGRVNREVSKLFWHGVASHFRGRIAFAWVSVAIIHVPLHMVVLFLFLFVVLFVVVRRVDREMFQNCYGTTLRATLEAEAIFH